jgi:hypothetical protein
MVKAIRTVRNEEIGYVATSKEYNAVPITYFIPKLQNNAPRSTLFDMHNQNGTPLKYVRQKGSGNTKIIYLNTISNPLSVVEEAAGKDCFKIFMMQHTNKMSLGQPT